MNRPLVNRWVEVYFILNLGPFIFLCIWAIADAWFPSEKVLLKHPDPNDHFYLFNKSLALFSAIVCLLGTIPIWIIKNGRGKPWVWMTTLVFIVLGITYNPLVGIPVLVFWIKNNNRDYYGILNNPQPEA